MARRLSRSSSSSARLARPARVDFNLEKDPLHGEGAPRDVDGHGLKSIAALMKKLSFSLLILTVIVVFALIAVATLSPLLKFLTGYTERI